MAPFDLLSGPDGRLHSGWRFLLSLPLVVFSHVLASLVAGRLFAPDLRFDAYYRPVLMLLLLGGSCGLLWAFDRQPYPFQALGLGLRTRPLRQIALGAIAGIGMVSSAVTCVALRGRIQVDHRPLGAVAPQLVLALFVLATAAMAEELIFRGYPFQRLVEAVGPNLAVALTAAFFGLAHLGNPHVMRAGEINTALFGVFLAVGYLRVRSLWLPFALHFSWNTTLGLVFGLPLSGTTEFQIAVRSTAYGPEWLTGGAYGLEGSWVTTVVIAAALLILLAVPSSWLSEAPAENSESGTSSGRQASNRPGLDGPEVRRSGRV